MALLTIFHKRASLWLLLASTICSTVRAFPREESMDCDAGGQSALSSAGCPCNLEGEKCRGVNTVCTNSVCTRSLPGCDFKITLSAALATIPCSMGPHENIGIAIKGECAQLPLKDCRFAVDNANGTDPNDVIGGQGDIYKSEQYGPCPFKIVGDNMQLNDNTTKNCSENTKGSVNRPYNHVLTTQYLRMDPKSNELVLHPHELLFDPPNPKPYVFVPSSDLANGLINQYYSVQCVDSTGKTSNTEHFQITFPFCP